MDQWSSLNPYENHAVIRGDSPEDLVVQLSKIKTPIKVVNWAYDPAARKRWVAIIIGDVRQEKKSEPKKSKQIKEGN